jgi:DNA polymerase IV (DinB-like DNA polymerase)
MRIIMLIDMDYFYVACEELRNKEVKDRPTIVGADPKGGLGRGVVMTCNYAAREFGIHSGMPISMAYRLKPDALYLPLDYDYYEAISKRIMELVKGFAGRFEQVSVDEAFMDVSGRLKGYEEAEEYAKKMQKSVLGTMGMKCSIGIGPNKLIAKMACERAKPNGIRMVRDSEVKEFLSGSKVEELYGIGAKTAERLKKLGYATVDQLAKARSMVLADEFGTSFGAEIRAFANGVDEREVTENYDVKSIGREFTFEKDTGSDDEIKGEIERLSREVMKDVERNQVSFRTITIKLRYQDFTEHIHSRSVKVTNSIDTLIQTADELYAENVDRTRKVRKIGVRVSGLVSYKGQKRIA